MRFHIFPVTGTVREQKPQFFYTDVVDGVSSLVEMVSDRLVSVVFYVSQVFFVENLHVLSCFVLLKSVLLISCVFSIFFQNAGSQLCFRFFLENVHVLFCFVRLESVLFNLLCVLDLAFSLSLSLSERWQSTLFQFGFFFGCFFLIQYIYEYVFQCL